MEYCVYLVKMNDISDTPYRQLYRERPNDEMELVADHSGSPVPSRLVSAKDSASVSIVFQNKSVRDARLLWIDFDGHEVAYGALKPGQMVKYSTFRDHPWIARALPQGDRLLLNGALAFLAQGSATAAVIEDVPKLEWSQTVHHLFPVEFRQQTCALMLAAYWDGRLPLHLVQADIHPHLVPKTLQDIHFPAAGRPNLKFIPAPKATVPPAEPDGV